METFTKENIIRIFFDRSALLKINQKSYAADISRLFEWLLKTDGADTDISCELLSPLVNRKVGNATIIAKENGVLAGMEEVGYFFSKQGLIFKNYKNDGDIIRSNEMIAKISGQWSKVIACERTILNIIQRLSGIATETNQLQKLVGKSIRIAATRKTPWGLLDKKAVAVGGGLTHRLSLSDGILIKDNHLNLLKSETITPLLSVIQLISRKAVSTAFEIEVRSPEEAFDLVTLYLNSKIKTPLVVMLDNFTPELAGDTIKSLLIKSPLVKKKILFEVSGGINRENILDYSQSGADVVSLGSLTHSAKTLDISLQFE